MKPLLQRLCLCLLLPTAIAHAETSRQECVGRLTFAVPEDMQWAVAPNKNLGRITQGIGQAFNERMLVGQWHGTYGYGSDAVHISVSDKISRRKFEDRFTYDREMPSLAEMDIRKDIETHEDMIKELKKDGYPTEDIARVEVKLKQLEKQLSDAPTVEYDLGIADAHFRGDKYGIGSAVLWRNERVYAFRFSGNDFDDPERIKAFIARFQPRELYAVPKGPGFCFPYGFIADDGKTTYTTKNSLRFTRTPNVVIAIINAAAGDPAETKPTLGTYNNDYMPGYDARNWKKTEYLEPLHIGSKKANLIGWRLDPKPGSNKQDRAWFGLAHTGGLLNPLIAIQVSTFEQGTDDLKDPTSPPEEVLPSLKALTKSLKQTLGE